MSRGMFIATSRQCPLCDGASVGADVAGTPDTSGWQLQPSPSSPAQNQKALFFLLGAIGLATVLMGSTWSAGK